MTLAAFADNGEYTGRPALVTGASGHIGRSLVYALLARGAQVCGVSRHNTGPEPATWASVDVTDPVAIERLVLELRPDVVFHLANYVTGSRSLEVVAETAKARVMGTVHLLTAVAQLDPPPSVVMSGSMEEPAPGVPPGSPYAAAQSAARIYGDLFHALYDVPVVNLRVFMVYGPGRQNEQRLVPYTIRSYLAGQPPQLSSGTRQVDWIHIDDVVSAFLSAGIHARRASGSTCDIGSGKLTSVRDVVRRVAAIVGTDVAPGFGGIADRALEGEPVANLTEARRLLGWAPVVDLDEGLASTVAWFRRREGR